jgi:predicted aminopeptidase
MCTGCYTVKAGYYQLRLLSRREPIADVVRERRESAERLAKLAEVPGVVDFARGQLGLTPGKSYTTYVPVEGGTLQWLVEAAERRRLKRKSWWFPLVGAQPYLGFAKREDADALIRELQADNYDTKLGRVQAFSMLGYLADPVYSTMLDDNSLPELVEVLIHEMVHATIYIPNFPVFNENVATFIAGRGTQAFFGRYPRSDVSVAVLAADYQRHLEAQRLFQRFLKEARRELNRFYEMAERMREWENDELFLKERQQVFDGLAEKYWKQVGSAAAGTWYEHAFAKGRINNAVVLGYSLYEARQEPFSELLEAVSGDLKRLVSVLRECAKEPPEREEEIWDRLSECRKELR